MPFAPPAGEEILPDCTGSVAGVPGATIEFSGYAEGTVTYPAATPGGVYTLEVTCPTNTSPADEAEIPYISGTAMMSFARVLVDKVVTGDAPDGTDFVVNLDCTYALIQRPPVSAPGWEAQGEGLPQAIQADLTYGAAGGTQQVIAYGAQTCDLTETETGGALAVTVDTEDCGELRGTAAPTEATSGDFTIYEPVDCTQTVTNEFAPADVGSGVVEATPPFTG